MIHVHMDEICVAKTLFGKLNHKEKTKTGEGGQS